MPGWWLIAALAVPGLAKTAIADPMRVPSTKQIEGLIWELPVRTSLPYRPATAHEKSTGKAPVVVLLQGKFQKEDWALIFLHQHVQVKPDGEFEISVPLVKRSFSIELMAIGPLGEILTEQVNLVTPDFEAVLAAKAPPPEKISPFAVSISAGATFLNYSQTKIQDLSLVALTPKLSATYRVNQLWDIGANAFMGAMTLSTNRPEVSVGFLGANGRIGYRLPFVKDPWSFKVLVGAYYSTMFVSNAAFGYNNLFGPQLFPAIQRQVGKFSISAYAKLSPISDGPAILALSNRELAFGLSASRALNGGRGYGLSLDFAQLSFATTTKQIISTSTTIGAFFQF